MPMQVVRIDREEILEVLADRVHILRAKDAPLDRTYFDKGDNKEVLVRPGLFVALNTSSKKYVPYNSSASYGAGSDTNPMLLDTVRNATHEDPVISPVIHGKAIEAHCYVYAGALGTVPAAVKSALPGMFWV